MTCELSRSGEAAGKLSQCKSFDELLDPTRVRKLKPYDEIRPFYRENLAVLRSRGIRPDLQRALERCLRRTRRKHARLAFYRIWGRERMD